MLDVTELNTKSTELDITPIGSSVKNDPVWPLNAPDIAVAVNGDDVKNELVCALVTKFTELDNRPDGNSVKNELVCALVIMPISLPNPSANVTGFCVVSA